jgi:phosphoribosylaminoimidazole-succinocarboxamide synthase
VQPAVLRTEIPGLPPPFRGKVRDVYDLGDSLLIVATDRISAFDVVMPNGIPDKGRVLTQLSRFWFRTLRPLVSTHYITTDEDFIARRLEQSGAGVSSPLMQQLSGRSMLSVKAEVYPVECVVRGWLSGSLWKEYAEAGGPTEGCILHDITLPAGLQESARLEQPIFTPATKAASGHDENIGWSQVAEMLGVDAAEALRSVSVAIYNYARETTEKKGLILADTKFEFGRHNGVLTLVDEVLTPDSSRYWDQSIWAPGGPQPSYDKQYVRDWLLSTGWNREPPAPQLPEDVVFNTRAKYLEAYQRITGTALALG